MKLETKFKWKLLYNTNIKWKLEFQSNSFFLEIKFWILTNKENFLIYLVTIHQMAAPSFNDFIH